MMSSDQFEGSSLEGALVAAATALGEAADALEYEVIEEKSADFWGLGETSVRIRAWLPASEPSPEPAPAAGTAAPAAPGVSADALPAADVSGVEQPDEAYGAAAVLSDYEHPVAEAPFFAAPAPPPAPADADPAPSTTPEQPHDREGAAAEAPASSASVAATDDLAQDVVALLGRIFAAMGFDCTVETEGEDDVLQIRIGGDDNEYLLDSRGRGLAAIELLVNHAFRHSPHGRTKLRVDAGGFRDQRDEEIRDLAYQVAHQAKETELPQQTRPLNPYERRIVHLTLADDADVTTRSQGSGFMKTVNVVPTSRGHN